MSWRRSLSDWLVGEDTCGLSSCSSTRELTIMPETRRPSAGLVVTAIYQLSSCCLTWASTMVLRKRGPSGGLVSTVRSQ